MEKEKISITENKLHNDHIEKKSNYLSTLQKKLSSFDSQKSIGEDSGRKIIGDENTLQLLSSDNKDSLNSNILEIKIKSFDKKGSKQIKTKFYSGLEKETNLHQNAKVVDKKSVDMPSLEGIEDLESNSMVHESLDTFIRQTMGCEPYVSFTSRPGEKPLQKIIEHQQALNKCIKSLKVDIDIHDCREDNAYLEPYQVDLHEDLSKLKGGVSLGRGLQTNRNPQTIKNNVPQVVATYASTKNQGKQYASVDHLIDLPSWPLLSPSKFQLQKCDKCSREFFSSFNHRRHVRTHRRISYLDKEDLSLKRKNVAAFWDKLNQEEAQQIFASSRKYDVEDLLGEVVVNHLLASKKQNNPITLPPAYKKAGQELLDMLDNKHIVFPLFSEQILSILDEANERTFLCSQSEVSKIGLEEKNLVASLGFIVEQTLVKAWMADKDAEALRNQQELVKEEEAAQMKREKNVAKKKKKKEKSRQRGLKERKGGIIQLALNEENESIDEENPSFEMVEEDNSPTASSTSMNSSGLESSLFEHSEMEVNSRVQNTNERIQNIGAYGEHSKISKDFGLDSTSEEQVQQRKCDLITFGKEGELYSKFSSYNQIKIEDQGRNNCTFEQNQNVLEPCKRTPLRSNKELIKFNDHDSYQRTCWILDPRFQDGIHQNFQRTLRKPLIGTPYTSNIEFNTNLVPGFYRSKPPSLKGNNPFPIAQQWAKKTQTRVATDFVNKIDNDIENAQRHDIYTNRSNSKDLDEDHTTIACEMNVDVTNSLSGGGKEEFGICGKKNQLPSIVPTIAKVVGGIGCLNNISTTSFNLNVNSEDWPPLSNSHATYYPKRAKTYSLTSYQCELDSRPPKKLNFDKGGDHKESLDYKVEESIATTIPPLRRSMNETTTTSTTTSLQKGIMIGSVSVPLGDFMHPSKTGLESVGRKVNTPSLAHQSYTVLLASPLIRYIEDPMASTTRQQRQHDEINHLQYEDLSTIQLKDSYGDQVYYKTSLIRSTPCMNFNVRHMRGPTYPLGDRGERGILSKQPSWSSGLIRNLPQKVWRPIRPTSANVGSNLSGEINIETSMTCVNEKINEGLDAREFSSQSTKCTQVQDIDMKKVDEGSTLTMNSVAEIEGQKCIMDIETKKENAPKDITSTFNESLINLNVENSQNCQETIQVDFGTNTSSDYTCKPFEHNAYKMDPNCSFHDKKPNNEMMDDMAYIESNSNHSTWIAEAIEFHFTRWQLALKDPETIIDNCEEHPELQTSRWTDFMSTLPSITTKLSCYGQ